MGKEEINLKYGSGGDDHFRNGIRPLRGRRTVDPSRENCAAERHMGSRVERGPPYIQWESLTDAATSLYEYETTGTQPRPKTKEEWGAQNGGVGREITSTMFRWRRKGKFEAVP